VSAVQQRILLVAGLTAIVMAPLVWAAYGLNFLLPKVPLQKTNHLKQIDRHVGEQSCPPMALAGVRQHRWRDIAGRCGPARFTVVGEGGGANQVELNGTRKPEPALHIGQRALSKAEASTEVRTFAQSTTKHDSNTFCPLAPKLELLANSVSSMTDTRPMGAATNVLVPSPPLNAKVIRNKSRVTEHPLKQQRKELSIRADSQKAVDFYVGPHIIVLCSHMTTVEKHRAGCL